MTIDDHLYKIMRIQCLWIGLCKAAAISNKPLPEEFSLSILTTLCGLEALLETELGLREQHQKKKKKHDEKT